jgi:hypothetical protein
MADESSARVYHIAWRSKLTGHTGAGVSCMSREVAEAERDRSNREWPDVHHWIERREESNR